LLFHTLPDLTINEIHYNPCGTQGDDFDFEFVEIFVGDDEIIDLGGFEFYNSASGEPQLGYVFPEGTTVAPGEYFLMTVSDEGTANYAGFGCSSVPNGIGQFLQ
jgi:hypothetical protein